MARQVDRMMGFDCEFVEPPSEMVQAQCPVCLLIIREPHQVTCCGKRFCQACIQYVKTTNKPCPTCNAVNFLDFSDLGFKQDLYSLQVRCYYGNMCAWTGELRQLEEHLNTDPQPDRKQHGCPVVPISCDFYYVGCAVKIPRKDMPKHLRESLHMHLSLVATSHAKLAHHHFILDTKHKELKHEFSGLANSHTKLLGEHVMLTGSHKKLEEKYNTLTVSHERLREEYDTLSTSSVQQLCRYDDLKDVCDNLKSDNHLLKSRIETLEISNIDRRPAQVQPTPVLIPNAPRRETIPITPSALLVMENFDQYKRNKNWWYSPPVYTHYQGYKFCIGIVANGHNSGRGTHVSAYIYFMKGEFDDFLPWPFRGLIYIELVGQGRAATLRTHECVYDETRENEYCQQVKHTERATMGWGTHTLIAHNLLKPYLNRNCATFRISGGEARV